MATTSGAVSQISDLPLANGAQFGFAIDPGKPNIDTGMSGGAILDAQGNCLGINAISPSPDYTYNDGSKPIPQLAAQYARVNWAIPIYNFLTHVKPEIVASYNLPKLERQVPLTGDLAQLNDKARHLSVRIENSDGKGSGVIIAKEGSTYYVLTAKHIIQDERNNTHQKFTNLQIVTADRDRHKAISTVVDGIDLAVVKFTSDRNYPVAQIGNYSPISRDRVFIGGFPSREQISSPFWQWQLNSGSILSRERINKSPDRARFDLVYSGKAYSGMGGGAVFDAKGKVIGIHLASEPSDRSSEGNKLGISSQTFLKFSDRLQVRSGLLSISSR